MSESNKQRKSVTQLLVIYLFIAILLTALVANALAYIRLVEARKRMVSANATLEHEKAIADELTFLAMKFKRYESEYQLMEHGLKQLYASKCTGLNEFIPVFDDLVVTCRPKRNFRNAYEAMVHVPKHGDHRLTIESVKMKFSDVLKYRPENHEVILSESFPLEPGANQSVAIYPSTINDRKIFLNLSGQKSKLIEFPFGRIASTGTRDVSYERTVMSLNQYSANPKTDQAKFWFGSVIFYPKTNGQRGNGDVLLLRLAIDSDGPFTSLPDDLMVVRKLLRDYEAGVEPKFVFSIDGLYEFK